MKVEDFEINLFGGVNFLCRSIFGEYAELCFAEFGDRVKHWGTFNEIHHITFSYPNVGCRSPSGVCGDVHRQPYVIGHHMLLSHSKAVEIYRAKFQVTLISVSIATRCKRKCCVEHILGF